MIREVTLDDAKQIIDIYNDYIVNTDITFEEEVLTVDDMKKRILDITKSYPWFVYVENDLVLGYAYASKWKTREAYRFSVESSVYVVANNTAKGIGSKLYTSLIDHLRKSNVHCIIGGVALPNEKSVGLHEKLGFTKIGEFKEVGFKFNRWINVGYWQLNI